jgi:hypothetical protein
VGISVAGMSSVASAVTGGGELTTFVLVAPPPQATSTIANSISIDNNMLVFLILTLLLSKYEELGAIPKKYATLKKQMQSQSYSFSKDFSL